jgi:hypothetical protein
VLFQEQGTAQADEAASLGKSPTTSLRRLISPLSRSGVDQDLGTAILAASLPTLGSPMVTAN